MKRVKKYSKSQMYQDRSFISLVVVHSVGLKYLECTSPWMSKAI